MCNGNAPAAPESKDLIAIIHPSQQPQQLIAGRLRLSNRSDESQGTISEWQSLHSHLPYSPKSVRTLKIRIHRFGQPIDIEEGSSEAACYVGNPIMYTFTMTMGMVRADAGSRFDLGVGGDGLIGRTISIANEEFGLLGQGIIGRI